MRALLQDVRYAIRILRRSPGFAGVAVLTLALGIGANTAIFSVVNSLILRRLPVVEPQRLVVVSSGDTLDYSWTYAIWEQIRQRAQMFDGAFAWTPARFNLAQRGETQPVDGLFASGDFFTTLGVSALLGRTFSSADDERGGGPDGPVAVISYRLWQRRFGGATNVIGMPLVIEHIPFTIIGVTSKEFFGIEVGRAYDVALPLSSEALIRGKETAFDRPRAWWLKVMLRLKSGQTLNAANATLRGMQPQIRESTVPQEGSPGARRGFEELDEPFTLMPAAAGTSRLRQQYERPLLTVLVLVMLVLLIACVNIANLLLARATARRHEVSMRLALGASRWRLARQMFVENLLLAGLGAIVGLLFAAWGSRVLVAQLSTSVSPVALDLSLDWRVLAFAAAVTSATAVLFGTAPALHSTQMAPIDALNQQGRAASGDAPVTLSSGLVVGQIAVSLVLVVAAGLLVRTFERLATLPLGFDSDRVLVVNVDATRAHIDPTDRVRLYHRLVEAVAAVPGVEHAAGSSVTPISGSLMAFPVNVPGAPPMSGPERRVLANYITPRWFAAYGTAILAGRDIDDRDTRNAPPVVIVNEAFVRKFFPNGHALGRTITSAEAPAPRTIVGVVGDAVYRTVRDDIPPIVYQSMAQRENAPNSLSIGVRASAGSPGLLARRVAAAITAVNGSLDFTFRPLADQVGASLAQERLVAMLSGLFGALALLLAGLGLYGITSYAAARRRAEIGIRMALGAQRADVMRLILGRSIALTLVGIVLGLVGAAVVTRYLKAMLFGLTPLDVATFIVVSLLFVVVATLAAFSPARCATKVDPLIALRSE